MASLMGMGLIGKAMGGDEGASAFGVVPALLSRKKKAATPGSAAGSTIMTDAMARRGSASV